MNIDIWLVSKPYRLFKKEVLILKQNVLKKKKVVTGKTRFLVIGPFCTTHSICHNIGF